MPKTFILRKLIWKFQISFEILKLISHVLWVGIKKANQFLTIHFKIVSNELVYYLVLMNTLLFDNSFFLKKMASAGECSFFLKSLMSH